MVAANKPPAKRTRIKPAEFVTEYANDIRAIARWYARKYDLDGDDTEQDLRLLLLRAVSRAGAGTQVERKPRQWIFSRARRVVLRAVRDRNRLPSRRFSEMGCEDDTPFDPADPCSLSDGIAVGEFDAELHARHVEQLRAAARRLPRRLRFVIARRMAGWTLARIGERLGMTGTNVRYLERCAIAQLRARMIGTADGSNDTTAGRSVLRKGDLSPLGVSRRVSGRLRVS